MSGLCRRCGVEMAAGRRWYCSDKCKRQDERAEVSSLRNVLKELGAREMPRQEERRVIITDAEQRKINLEIDARYRIELEYKRYKPGDPEFDAVAVQCTPPSRIKSSSVVDGYERRAMAVPILGQGRIRRIC